MGLWWSGQVWRAGECRARGLGVFITFLTLLVLHSHSWLYTLILIVLHAPSLPSFVLCLDRLASCPRIVFYFPFSDDSFPVFHHISAIIRDYPHLGPPVYLLSCFPQLNHFSFPSFLYVDVFSLFFTFSALLKVITLMFSSFSHFLFLSFLPLC